MKVTMIRGITPAAVRENRGPVFLPSAFGAVLRRGGGPEKIVAVIFLPSFSFGFHCGIAASSGGSALLGFPFPRRFITDGGGKGFLF